MTVSVILTPGNAAYREGSPGYPKKAWMFPHARDWEPAAHIPFASSRVPMRPVSGDPEAANRTVTASVRGTIRKAKRTTKGIIGIVTTCGYLKYRLSQAMAYHEAIN